MPLFCFLQLRAEYLSPYDQSVCCRAIAVVHQHHRPSEDTVRTSCSLSVEWEDSSPNKTKRLLKLKSIIFYEEEWEQAHFKNWESASESKGFGKKSCSAPCVLAGQVRASRSALTQLSGSLSCGKFCIIPSVPRKPLFLSLLGMCLLPFPLRVISVFSCAAHSKLLMTFSAFSSSRSISSTKEEQDRSLALNVIWPSCFLF